MSDPFYGEVRIFSFNYAPQGWAYCNGQTMNIGQNPALYSLLTTTYGGDGKTTFQLPDLQGRAPMGSGSGPNLTSRQAGGKYGQATVTLTSAQAAVHHHTVNGALAASATEIIATPDNNHLIGFAPNQYSFGKTNYPANTPPVVLNGGTISVELGGTNGQATPHENRQPYLALNLCICIEGLYPDRP